ncbi:MAG: ThuA domain-containing protein [Actinomycetota bacterium]
MTGADSLRILIVTKGHPFEAEPFFAVFDALGHEWDHVEWPEAEAVLTTAGTADYDALVMYDMPGIRFTGDEPPAEFDEPSPSFQQAYLDLLDAGRGMVFLHHAIASWPAWPEFAKIVGGRFHYQPAQLGGREWPDSGYRFNVTHTVEVLEADHPICAGLDPTFDIVDELYCFPVFEDDVVPLMRSTFDFAAENFSSADLAIRGQRNSSEGWTHPRGSDLVAWVKNAANSPVAYVQFADGPVTYADANYRRVVDNAIRWTAADDAHAWARERNRS